MIKGKNTHLFHLEELYVQGIMSFEEVLTELRTLLAWSQNYEKNSRESMNITIKFDGSPAVLFGKHPKTGEFIIGTKSLLSKKQIYATSVDQIIEKFPRKMTPDKNGNHVPELVDHLTHLFHLLSQYEFDAIYQGDLLYTPDTLKKNPSGSAYEFKPNTLTYKVLAGSQLGSFIKKSPCGMVVHTKYTGKTLQDLVANFVQEPVYLENIWSPNLYHFNSVTIYSESSRARAAALLDSLSKRTKPDTLDSYSSIIFCKLINSLIKEKEAFPSIDQIIEKVQEKNDEIDQKNMQIREKNKSARRKSVELRHVDINYNLVTFFRDLVSCKNRIIKALHDCSLSDEISCYVVERNEKITTHHEGYVVKSNFIYKLVNRADFSLKNFLDETPWKLQKIQKNKKLDEKVA